MSTFSPARTLASQPGRLVVWGSETSSLVSDGAPSGTFVTLAAGGSGQTLAIRADRRLFINYVPEPGNGTKPIPLPVDFDGQEFCAVGAGRSHGLAIRPDKSVVAWPPIARKGAPTKGEFVQVKGAGGYYSIALDTNGDITLWCGQGVTAPDYAKIVGVGAPSGRFKAIDARARYMLALREDGRIYGWGTGSVAGVDFPVFGLWKKEPPGHFIAPMDAANPYVAIAAGLDLIVALRADGTAAQWAVATAPPIPLPPAGVAFTHIAAGYGFAAGIDRNGHVHAWGTPDWVGDVPDGGTYSAISAATSHIAVIEAPKRRLWPPDHKMRTIAVTFRADQHCSPVPLSTLSVVLRSNQPDNGFGSGNTTGDTNGEDGYTSPVVLPATAISENVDGSFTATFELRAERSNALPGSRVYTVAVVTTDGATSANTQQRIAAQFVVEPPGQ